MKNEEKIEANSKEQKRKFALWIKESTLDLTKQYREQADCKSQSEFIEKAIRFYVWSNPGQAVIPHSRLTCSRRLWRSSKNIAANTAVKG